MKKAEVKIDKRKLHSQGAIKAAFLRIKTQKDFEDISVTELCKEAGISRGTFYTNFKNTVEVLEAAITDAISQKHNVEVFADIKKDCTDPIFSDSEDNEHMLPICEIIRRCDEYKCIFLDESLTPIIIRKIVECYGEEFISKLYKKYNLTQEQLLDFYKFRMNGCLALTRECINYDMEQWKVTRDIVDNIQKKGIVGYSKNNV